MGNSNPSQCSQVLEYIERFGSITQFEAMRDLGVMRLASRISELRKRGYDFSCEWIKVKNRLGKTCTIKRYSLREEE